MFHKVLVARAGLFSLCVVCLICLLCLPQPVSTAWAQQPDPAGEETEPNDQFGFAVRVKAPGQVQGRIEPAGDVDWYAVNLKQRGELRLMVTGVAPELDLNLRVWNTNAERISDWFAPPAKGSDTKAVLDVAEPRDYFLEVAAGDRGASSVQPYILQIVFIPAPDGFEPNNSFGAAAELTLDQPHQATILPRSDADWYAFQVDTLGELQLTVSQVPQDLDIIVRVYDADKRPVSDWIAPLAPGEETFGVIDLSPGRYYLELSDGGNDGRSIQPYMLSASFAAAADTAAEPTNNALGGALRLSLNQPFAATILPRGDVDWYQLEVEGRGELRMTIRGAPLDLDMQMRLRNANGDAISDWFVSPAKSRDTVGLVDLPGAGRYYLEVSDRGNDGRSIEPYKLTFSLTATADRDTEPNDTFGDATTLSVGEPHSANILPRGDVEWYWLAVPDQGELRVTITQVPSGLDMEFRVANANAEWMSDWFASAATGADTSGSVDLPAAGRYYLVVRERGGDARSSQPYMLETRFTPVPAAGEPNNTFGSASPLTIGQPVAGSIFPKGDADWYQFEADGRGELQVEISQVPSELDLAFHIYDPEAKPLSDFFKPLAKGQATFGALDLPAAGRYRLEIVDAGNDARSVQPYSLTAVFTRTLDAFEPNDSFGTASSLEPGRQVQTTILPRGDVDWHCLTIQSHGGLRIAATIVPSALDITFRVYDGSKTPISGWFAPNEPGQDTLGTVDLPRAGRYCLELADRNNDARAAEPFSLVLNFMPSQDLNEPNNTLETATPVTLDTPVIGDILPQADHDWYAFQMPITGQLHVLITDVAPELDIYLRVHDGNQRPINNWYGPPAPGGSTAAQLDLPAPGSYYLEVVDGRDNARSAQPYLLYLSTSAIDPSKLTRPAPVAPSAAITPTTSITASGVVSPASGAP